MSFPLICLGPQLLPERKPRVAPQLSECSVVLPPLPSTLSWRLEAPSMSLARASGVLHGTDLTVPQKSVSPAGQSLPSHRAVSKELSLRASSVPGLRVEQGAWGFVLPSRDPGTVDRCGSEGTGAQGGRPSVEEPPCLNQSY